MVFEDVVESLVVRNVSVWLGFESLDEFHQEYGQVSQLNIVLIVFLRPVLVLLNGPVGGGAVDRGFKLVYLVFQALLALPVLVNQQLIPLLQVLQLYFVVLDLLLETLSKAIILINEFVFRSFLKLKQFN